MEERHIAFVVTATRCIGCRTCEIACKDFNGVGVGVRLRKVRTFEDGVFPSVVVTNISMSCNHCEEPACVRHCPAGAYRRRGDGIVVHDPELCIGCRYCTWLCPYGAPQYDEEQGRVRKCNLCVDEIDRGGVPACVAACPTRAIEIVRTDEEPEPPVAIRHLPPWELTRPTTRYRVRREAGDDGTTEP